MNNAQNKKKILIAVAMGFLTALTIYSAITNMNAQITNQNKVINVLTKEVKKAKENTQKEMGAEFKKEYVIAKQDLKAGIELTLEMLETKEFNVNNPDVFKNINNLVGKQLKINIKKGDLILKESVLNEADINYSIPTGNRAITIPVNFIQGLASYVKIGSKVDIISTVKSQGQKPEIILENIKIISLETKNKSIITDIKSVPSTDASAITFEIPAEKASNLVDSMVSGKLQIVVRGVQDGKKISNHKSNISAALPKLPDDISALENREYGALPIPQMPETKEQKKVEIIQANMKTQMTFDSD
ncbi:MAG: Flp pilus assembly protein CpaB [Candidatus Gastranaerophilales bacterium]|nr:Flp pilus assembly protein CpaB [Candidatus Gastranaerophilales bacterium]